MKMKKQKKPQATNRTLNSENSKLQELKLQKNRKRNNKKKEMELK